MQTSSNEAVARCPSEGTAFAQALPSRELDRRGRAAADTELGLFGELGLLSPRVNNHWKRLVEDVVDSFAECVILLEGSGRLCRRVIRRGAVSPPQ